MQINNIENILDAGKTVTIILEGMDGTGKSTLALSMFNVLHALFPYRVLLMRNPDDLGLYRRIHEGVYTPYEIAMNTLADALSAKNNTYAPGYIIIQDRSAAISSQAYNAQMMQNHEYEIYNAAMKRIAYLLIDEYTCIVLLTNKTKRIESNEFATSQLANAAYELMAEDKMDAYNNRINTYNNDTSDPIFAAQEIINLVNDYFGGGKP